MKRIARTAIKQITPFFWKYYFSKKEADISWNNKSMALTLSYDIDYPEDMEKIPHLLELCDSYGIKSSFACIGKFIEKNPSMHSKILDGGHEIINHSYSHPDGYFVKDRYFNRLSLEEIKEEVLRMHEVSNSVLDYQPSGFRTPHFGELNTPYVYEVLDEIGYMYSSSTNLAHTQSYGLPYQPSKEDFKKCGEPSFNVLEMPLFSCPEHILSVFDTWHMYHSNPPAHKAEGEFLRLFDRAIDISKRYGIYMNIYLDPRDLGNEYEHILEITSEKQRDIWVDTSSEIIKWWRKKYC